MQPSYTLDRMHCLILEVIFGSSFLDENLNLIRKGLLGVDGYESN